MLFEKQCLLLSETSNFIIRGKIGWKQKKNMYRFILLNIRCFNIDSYLTLVYSFQQGGSVILRSHMIPSTHPDPTHPRLDLIV